MIVALAETVRTLKVQENLGHGELAILIKMYHYHRYILSMNKHFIFLSNRHAGTLQQEQEEVF